MSNFKKVIAVVITLVMLLGVVGISSSAASVATVKLSGRTQATAGDTYYLTVSVEENGADVKGLEGIITYDTEMFTYKGYTLESENGYINIDYINIPEPDEAGTIKFVVLEETAIEETAIEETASDKWFTLEFQTSETVGTADPFTATIKGADNRTYLDVAVSEVGALTTYNDIVNVDWAELKADANDPDLRFKLTYNLDELANYDPNASVKEYGVLIGLSKSLDEAELTLDKASESYVVKASATPDDSFTGAVTVYANISNSYSANKNLLGVRVIARAYIVLDDGNDTVIYSNNDSDYAIDGTSTRSMIGCAKIAAGWICENPLVSEDDAARLEKYSKFTGVLPYDVPAEADPEKNPDKLSKTELLGFIQEYSELFLGVTE